MAAVVSKIAGASPLADSGVAPAAPLAADATDTEELVVNCASACLLLLKRHVDALDLMRSCRRGAMAAKAFLPHAMTAIRTARMTRTEMMAPCALADSVDACALLAKQSASELVPSLDMWSLGHARHADALTAPLAAE